MTTNKKQTSLLVSERFFRWIKDNERSQIEFCEELGVNRQAISNWKKVGVPAYVFPKIAELMGIPVEILTAKKGEVDVVTSKVVMLPLIDSVHAGAWTGLGNETYDEYIPVMTKCSPKSFCLKVEGKSMEPRFLEGDIVVVDTERLPSPGKFVVATQGDNPEGTIKKYKAIGLDEKGREIFELVPENKDFASYRSDLIEIRIVGVVVSVIRDL